MITITPQLAIQATLNGDWEKAIELNLELLKVDSHNIETLNRLAFAYTVLGKIQEARNIYNQVLELDKTNPIALKNMKRLGDVNRRNNVTPFALQHDTFLEVVGQTKMVTLLNPAPANVLRTLQVGQAVQLVIKRSKIFILTQQEQYVGMLPDDISRRLVQFISGGNQYVAHMHSVDDKNPCIFIRETKRVSRFKNQPSFIDAETLSPLTVHRNSHDDEGFEAAEE